MADSSRFEVIVKGPSGETALHEIMPMPVHTLDLQVLLKQRNPERAKRAEPLLMSGERVLEAAEKLTLADGGPLELTLVWKAADLIGELCSGVLEKLRCKGCLPELPEKLGQGLCFGYHCCGENSDGDETYGGSETFGMLLLTDGRAFLMQGEEDYSSCAGVRRSSSSEDCACGRWSWTDVDRAVARLDWSICAARRNSGAWRSRLPSTLPSTLDTLETEYKGTTWRADRTGLTESELAQFGFDEDFLCS